MKNFLLSITILLLLYGCKETSEHAPVLITTQEKQPIYIVNKNRHLKMAAFWIDQLPNPDKVIMDLEEIKRVNQKTALIQHRLTRFEDTAPKYRASWIKKSILHALDSLRKTAHYFEDGNRIEDHFFEESKNYMQLNALQQKSVTTRYALTVNYTNQRIIPTELSLLKKPKQIYFDRNQNSALDIATPLVILHTTTDGLWHYAIAPTSSGWIKDSDIAFGDKASIQSYLESKQFIITTQPKTALNIGGEYHDYLRMGVRLPVVMTIDEMSMVLVPTRDKEGQLIFSKGTLRTDHTHRGYLPYTARNILNQAFKFLNTPYGWGGMYGEQDCSKFIQEIYATTGLMVPRNSSAQANMNVPIVHLENLSVEQKRERISQLPIGVTLLHLSGHIMLYVGTYKGEPYIIHTVWGSAPDYFALGRTAVTAVSFNDYIKQIDQATTIQE